MCCCWPLLLLPQPGPFSHFYFREEGGKRGGETRASDILANEPLGINDYFVLGHPRITTCRVISSLFPDRNTLCRGYGPCRSPDKIQTKSLQYNRDEETAGLGPITTRSSTRLPRPCPSKKLRNLLLKFGCWREVLIECYAGGSQKIAKKNACVNLTKWISRCQGIKILSLPWSLD